MANEAAREADERSRRLALSQRMNQLLCGFQISAAIGAVATLGVPDALAAAPARAVDLAEHLGADAHSLARVLEALTDVGIFEKLADGRFELTPLGETLRSDVPGSVRGAAMLWTDEWHWRAYGHFASSVRTGEAGMRPAHGRTFWEYLAEHPDTGATVNGMMSSASVLRAHALARTYDFGGVGRLVDIGGGDGGLLCAVLQAYPQLSGVVFDLPSVVGGARRRLDEAGLTDRTEVVAGDFFQGVPPGADVYVLSWILHDWDDEAAVRILANCRQAIGNAGRLLVIEMVLPSPDEPRSPKASYLEQLAKVTDLEMLAVVGGRERTQAEYGELLAHAGFRLTQILELESMPWSVIEAAPV
jgi:O-methyltransferase domain/Dimerisation domain